MVRTSFFDKNGVKKGAWSQEEDNKLRAYVLKYGHRNWRELPKFAGLSRCGKSCRLRWMNYLRPGLRHGNFHKDDEELIIILHDEFGNKWSKIAAKLQGRTDNEVKNYWHAHLKKLAGQEERGSGLKEIYSCTGKPSETSKRECEVMNQSRDLKVESFAPNTPCHPILESCPLSPQPSFSEVSHSISDYANNVQVTISSSSTSSASDWNAEARILPSFQNTSGYFWTQPFVTDQDGYWLPLLEDSLLSQPYSTCYEDSIDLFYQVMQEFPGN